MAQQAAGDAPVIDHRQLSAGRRPRVEPRHGALPGATADGLGVGEIGGEAGGGVIVIALHGDALAGDDAGADAVLGDRVGGGEAGAGGQGYGAAAPARLGALGIADAGDAAGGVLGGGGARGQGLGRRLMIVAQFEIGKVRRQALRLGEAAERVFGRRRGHRQGAFDKLAQGALADVGRGHDGLALAAKDAQADVL